MEQTITIKITKEKIEASLGDITPEEVAKWDQKKIEGLFRVEYEAIALLMALHTLLIPIHTLACKGNLGASIIYSLRDFLINIVTAFQKGD